MTETLSATPTEVSEWIKAWSVKVYDFHKKERQALCWTMKWRDRREVVLRDLAVESPMIHKTEE